MSGGQRCRSQATTVTPPPSAWLKQCLPGLSSSRAFSDSVLVREMGGAPWRRLTGRGCSAFWNASRKVKSRVSGPIRARANWRGPRCHRDHRQPTDRAGGLPKIGFASAWERRLSAVFLRQRQGRVRREPVFTAPLPPRQLPYKPPGGRRRAYVGLHLRGGALTTFWHLGQLAIAHPTSSHPRPAMKRTIRAPVRPRRLFAGAGLRADRLLERG